MQVTTGGGCEQGQKHDTAGGAWCLDTFMELLLLRRTKGHQEKADASTRKCMWYLATAHGCAVHDALPARVHSQVQIIQHVDTKVHTARRTTACVLLAPRVACGWLLVLALAAAKRRKTQSRKYVFDKRSHLNHQPQLLVVATLGTQPRACARDQVNTLCKRILRPGVGLDGPAKWRRERLVARSRFPLSPFSCFVSTHTVLLPKIRRTRLSSVSSFDAAY
jgi:hypothetical protein